MTEVIIKADPIPSPKMEYYVSCIFYQGTKLGEVGAAYVIVEREI